MGLEGQPYDLMLSSGTPWERWRYRVIVPYAKGDRKVGWYLSRAGHVKPGLNLGRPLSKAKYSPMTDSGPVP